MLGEIVLILLLEYIDLALQQTTHLRVDFGQWVLQQCRREYQRELLGIEAQGDFEELAVRRDIYRPAMREPRLGRLPSGAAQFTEDVVVDSDRAVADLIDRLDPRLVDFPGKDRPLAVHDQIRAGAANVNPQMSHEAVQRRLDVERVLHQQAHQSERMQSILLADQETEVRATRPVRAMLDDAVVSGERDPVLGVVEQLEVDTCFGQHFLGVGAQALQQRGNDQSGAHAHRRRVGTGLRGRFSRGRPDLK